MLSLLKRTMSAVALCSNSTGDKQHGTDMRDGSEWGASTEQNLMAWEAFRRFGCQDKRDGRGWGGSHTSFHIPTSLCSVILPWSIVALLTASRFSKGRSISSGNVPRLSLILFWTFVVAGELIKEHLITITCCEWMMLNGVTVLELTTDPCTHTESWSMCLCFLWEADVGIGH